MQLSIVNRSEIDSGELTRDELIFLNLIAEGFIKQLFKVDEDE